MSFQKEFQQNKETWNDKLKVHLKSEFYDVAGFKSGKSSLNSYEIKALGNVKGKSLLHLQCHFGQDTLSWSRLGARCVGVDISDLAIKEAEQLNRELDLNARFVCCNVMDTSSVVTETFDIVFTSYGTIGWLPDLKPWAKMISERLKPGGVFYIVEFHPIAWMFDYLTTPPTMRYGYQQQEAIYEEYEGSYTDTTDEKIISKEYGWNHGLGEVVNALIEAGLKVDYLHEHEASPYDIFPELVKNKDGYFERPDRMFPLIFEVHCTKPDQ